MYAYDWLNTEETGANFSSKKLKKKFNCTDFVIENNNEKQTVKQDIFTVLDKILKLLSTAYQTQQLDKVLFHGTSYLVNFL